MNHDLHESLRALANAGADAASPHTTLASRAVAAVERRHHRRPMVIAGLTGLGVLTAGAAAALGYSLLRDDPAPQLPDRLYPGYEAPASEPVTLACGVSVEGLSATDGPLVLGNEMVDPESATRFTISIEAGTIIPMYLRNVTAEPVTFTTAENPGIYLVQDGVVVAVPVVGEGPVGEPAGSTLAADEIQPLLEDRVVACPDADGATPASVPGGDYDAYGTLVLSLDGSAETRDIVGGPWPVHVEAAAVADDPPVATPATLPAANPDATFPECGAIVDIPTGPPPIELIAVSTTDTLAPAEVDYSVPLAPTLLIRAQNGTIAQASGQMSSTPVLVAVRDGVVVGSPSPADPTQVPFEMWPEGYGTPGREGWVGTGTVVTTLCTDPSMPLPQGSYSIWATQDFTFTSVTPWDLPYVTDPDAVTALTSYSALSQVARLWMDSTGQPSEPPGMTPGWPAPLTHEAVFGPDKAEPESVVWLATQYYGYGLDASLLPSRNSLIDLGYLDTTLPFACQAGLEAIGVDEAHRKSGYGTAVMFASASEAQTFVDLWEPLHGPVLGVVTGEVGETWNRENVAPNQDLNCVGWNDSLG